MANNCLQTTLKSVVQNDNLIKIGEMFLTVKSIDSPTATQSGVRFITGAGAVTLTAPGLYLATSFEGLTSEPKSTITIPANTMQSIYFANGNYKVILSNKYALVTLESLSADYAGIVSWGINEVIYNNTKNFDMTCNKGCYGDISNINANSSFGFRQFRANNSPITGDIAGFSNSTNCTSIELTNCEEIKGNIKSLGSLININSLLLRFTGVTGTIEEFVAAQVAAGRTSCSNLKCWYILSGTNVTFGGQHFSGAYNLKWENSGNKIIMSDEPTIEAANKIWAKGATAEEIAAWEQAGKTVVVVS